MNLSENNDRVVETGERMVFLVQSYSRPGLRYRVDATANGGGMQCACRDFITRRQTLIDAGAQLIVPGETICKHCEDVVWHFVRGLFRAMAKSEETPPRQSCAPGQQNAATAKETGKAGKLELGR